jgi:tetratricopeptide (TPR) repeat protein
MTSHIRIAAITAALVAGFSLTALTQASASTVIGQTAAFNCAQAANARNPLLPYALHDALATCDQAMTGRLSDKDRIATQINRGILEAAAGEPGAAIADYNAALVAKPDMADVYINRGSAYLHAANYESARADFDRAISLGTRNAALAYYDRGMANEKSGKVQDAYHDYKQALALSPDFQPAMTELARFQVVNPRFASN